MKIAFWVIGATCAGKSYYSLMLANKLGSSRKNLDLVFDIQNIYNTNKSEAYKQVIGSLGDVIVVDGIVPFNRDEDMTIVKNILNEYEIIYIVVFPPHEKWLENIEKRRLEHQSFKLEDYSKKDYEDYSSYLKKMVDRFIEVGTDSDLDIITMEQVRNLRYQHDGFTDVKWKQLKIPVSGKTILDLGCSSCQFEKFAIEDGASEYLGLDSNFSYFIRKNARIFDLNKLEEWDKPYDIVVCSSVMHYIHDKEKFVRECARITRELCVLEIPLDRGDGEELHLGSRGLYFPTKKLFERWVSSYFSSFECMGESIVEDGSYRLIYHCKK